MLGPIIGPLAFYAAKLRNRLLAYSVEEAALNVLFCAASPDIEKPGFANFRCFFKRFFFFFFF